MTRTDYADETLMAYADGELDPAQTADLDRAVAMDSDLAARVALFGDTREAVRTAALGASASDVPNALRERVLAMTRAAQAAPATPAPVPAPVPVTEKRLPVAANSNTPAWASARVAIAASVAALLFGIGGFQLGRGETAGPATLLAVSQPIGPEIAEGLSRVASGDSIALADGGAQVTMVSSFDVGGDLCREFELTRGEGSANLVIACRQDGAWTPNLIVATASSGGDGYVPASSTETIDAYLSSIEAGAALSPEDEAQRLGSNGS